MESWLCAIKVRRKLYPMEKKAFGKAKISFLVKAGLPLVINGRMGWIWISGDAGLSWKKTGFFFSQLLPLSGASQPSSLGEKKTLSQGSSCQVHTRTLN